jgi:hypothetical protein
MFMVRVVSQKGSRRAVDIHFPIASSEAEAMQSALARVARQRGLAPVDLQAEVVGRYPVPPSASGRSFNERA